MAVTVRVDATLDIHVEQTGRMAAVVAAASAGAGESLTLDAEGAGASARELHTAEGRVHLIDAPAGDVRLHYRAEVDLESGQPQHVDEGEALVLRRPSRYCPSDQVAGLAVAEFGGLEPRAAVFAIEQWLHDTVAYVPGSTDAIDDALHPLLSRTGVCRDFAHLGVTMCRALGIPARYTAAYAPGLAPMDFHAVFEAAIDDQWWVFDGTRLAPRDSLVRIASGRDAADTALLTPLGAILGPIGQDLTVTTSGDLPVDNRDSLVALSHPVSPAPRPAAR